MNVQKDISVGGSVKIPNDGLNQGVSMSDSLVGQISTGIKINTVVTGIAAEAAEESATGLVTKFDVENLNFNYGNFQALRNLNVNIPSRRITAIIGPSGSGKTTFLRLLNRMSDMTLGSWHTGQILLDGIDIFSPELNVVALRKRVGMVFQKPNPFPKTIYDNIAYGPRMHGTHKKKAEMDELVEHCLRQAALWDEVKDSLQKSALALSGGQQQRLCIARSISVEPEVILMDEPASALDPISTIKIEELMIELRRKYTIVIVTHNMQQAARASDYTMVFIMSPSRAGEIVEFGKTHDIFTNPQHEKTEQYITGRFG
jgi:phosphate transport system ATP-binding protein